MGVSVIIPTYNAQKYLPKLFNILKNQTISFEIIVIDSSSTDKTLEISKEYANKIITIPKVEFDHGGTRTKAAKEANGDILIFLTQDALPVTNDALEKLIKPLNKEVVASYGRQLPYSNATLFGRHLREFNYSNKSYIRSFKDAKEFGIKSAFLSDSFSAYKKEAIKSVGWFKEGTIFGEDMHLAARVLLDGKYIAYCADALVYHSHNYTIKEEFSRYFDTGVFHANESWLIEKFGKAEGEGLKYLKSEFNFCLKNRAYHLIPNFLVRNFAKILGYKLGKNYKKMPKFLAQSLSMHKSWWSNANRG